MSRKAQTSRQKHRLLILSAKAFKVNGGIEAVLEGNGQDVLFVLQLFIYCERRHVTLRSVIFICLFVCTKVKSQ